MRDNEQAPEKRQTILQLGHDKLDVHSIFYTIQGEGPFTGTPAVFVRLAGCNLQCPKCDTDYTSKRKWMTLEQIYDAIRAASFNTADPFEFRGLVVITGGEPLRQEAVRPLVLLLVQRGFYVQIETNGTLPPPDLSFINKTPCARRGLYIVCSPKAGTVNPAMAVAACAFKYVMAEYSVDPVDGLPIYALDHSLGKLRVGRPPLGYNGPIYLQPMDEQNPERNKLHLAACVDSCMRHGYILQLQTHKILGME